jgi:hypothetical protein
MPTRSAQPAGGLMSEGEAGSGVSPAYPVLDRQPTDRLLTASVQDHRAESDSSSTPDGSQTSGGLIALRGPGGFPLLGADAIGGWRGNSNERVASWAGEHTLQPDDFQAEEPPVNQELLLAANGIFPTADRLAGTEADTETGGGRPRDWLWGTLSTGLGTVTLLTLNALFSNPIAGYDVLPSRLDAAGTSGRGPVGARRNSTSVGFRRWARIKNKP